jgi:hypothetical protein
MESSSSTVFYILTLPPEFFFWIRAAACPIVRHLANRAGCGNANQLRSPSKVAREFENLAGFKPSCPAVDQAGFRQATP